MIVKGEHGASITISVGANASWPVVMLDARAAGGEFAVGVFLDENHAAALVLALQAAVAEIQARAVSR